MIETIELSGDAGQTLRGSPRKHSHAGQPRPTKEISWFSGWTALRLETWFSCVCEPTHKPAIRKVMPREDRCAVDAIG